MDRSQLLQAIYEEIRWVQAERQTREFAMNLARIMFFNIRRRQLIRVVH